MGRQYTKHAGGGKLQVVEYVAAGQLAVADKRPRVELETSSLDSFSTVGCRLPTWTSRSTSLSRSTSCPLTSGSSSACTCLRTQWIGGPLVGVEKGSLNLLPFQTMHDETAGRRICSRGVLTVLPLGFASRLRRSHALIRKDNT